MPTPIAVWPVSHDDQSTPRRVQWTRQQCQFLVDNALLNDRYELINGEVIDKMGQKPHHSTVVGYLFDWLSALFGSNRIRVQSTVEVDEGDASINEPEPDILVTHEPRASYIDRHPGPKDARLIAEVADTTVKFDLGVKANLYAHSLFPEYWVVDIPGRRVVVHREPDHGVYQSVVEYSADERLALQGHEEHPILVADLLPPSD